MYTNETDRSLQSEKKDINDLLALSNCIEHAVILSQTCLFQTLSGTVGLGLMFCAAHNI